MKAIPKGFCQCGCGQKTPIASRNQRTRGWTKGEPIPYIQSHNRRIVRHLKPRQRRHISDSGYPVLYDPEHARAQTNGLVREHLLVAERALGRPLPEGAVIHHLNGVRDDNRNQNLVICQDHAYHMLLHQRQRALAECGHASWRKCRFCGEYDDPVNMYVGPSKNVRHRKCVNAYRRARYRPKSSRRRPGRLWTPELKRRTAKIISRPRDQGSVSRRRP